MKDWKLTCPKCKKTIEGDTLNYVVLNLPHKKLCDANRRAGITYNDCDFEDRKLLNSPD